MLHIGIVVATVLANPVILSAEAVCGQRDDIMSSLARQFSEAPRELGLANNGAVIELTTSSDGRTWTLLLTRPDGTSCVIAAGEAWEAEPKAVAGQRL
ncbi:MAG: hypothetical protein M0006_06965 [Magnetospirillum sp.]|nr:hypothetical protein [Magnetospirillum sp.]